MQRSAWNQGKPTDLEQTETTDLEANPEEMKSEALHEEVLKEDAAVNSFGALKNWHRGLHLYSGRRGKTKERTQGNGGPQK
jgi:hypothetical protein